MNELMISLDGRSARPLYEQIYNYIKKEIQSGGLPFEERLPSTRKLSKHLQVSRSTVELAYEQLLSEGYIESIPYKGYYVSQLDGLISLKPEFRMALEKSIPKKESYIYDFTPSGIDLESFPHNAWRKISKNILNEENIEFFKLGDPSGEEELRTTIASYLYQARGVHCQPEQIIVGAGNDYLLMLLINLLGQDTKIIMENPTYKKGYRVLSALTGNISAVRMDENGIDIHELQKADGNITYVMPSHQYPMGTSMPIKRRMQLLEWASEKEERYIIEDDYDSEFRYKGKPIPALKSYDRNEKVIYLGTFSRSIAPSIRISYMILPGAIMDIYQQRGRVFSCTVSRVDQVIISRFLKEGYYERHLNKMRAGYKNRHDVLLNELQKLKDICRISGENAGVHLLLHFTNGMQESEAVERARRAGVKVYGLSGYTIGEVENMDNATVILGYATMEEKEIIKAVEILRRVWL